MESVGFVGVGGSWWRTAASPKAGCCRMPELPAVSGSRSRLTKMSLDLISKPMRPNSPDVNSGNKGGKQITDYSNLTDIRPDTKKPEVEKEVEVAPNKEDGGDDGAGVSDGDPNVVYYTECGRCKAVYVVRPKDIGMEGRRVSCSVCQNSWFQRRDRLAELNAEGEEMEDFPPEKIESYRREGNRPARNDNRNNRIGHTFTAFVGNLSFATTKEQLEELFSNRAATRVHLVEKEGKSKGFAFVDFLTRADLDKAVGELNGQDFDGRPMTVKEGRNSL